MANPADPKTRMYPMRFTWKEDWGGQNVSVTGEFNSWSQMMKLTRDTDQDFHIVIPLPQGRYMVKYIVDNDWRLAPDQPTVYDSAGNLNNIVVVDAEQCEREISAHRSQNSSPKSQTHHQPLIHDVIQYKERVCHSGALDSSDFPKNVNAKGFDVVVSPKVSPKAILDRENVARVSSYDMLVHLTLEKMQNGTPAREDMYENVKHAIQIALDERTRSLLHEAKHNLKTQKEQAICFDPKNTHPDLELDSSKTNVSKTVPGMYRSARVTQPILRDQQTYFEMLFRTQSNSGGICVGLSSSTTPLDCLVGSKKLSIGLYSTGDIIFEGKWVKYTKPFTQGAVIGVLATLTTQPDETQKLNVEFFIDGQSCEPVKQFLILAPNELVYPTATLYTSRTQVMFFGVPIDLVYGEQLLNTGLSVYSLDNEKLTREAINRISSSGNSIPNHVQISGSN
eukprot:c19705_g2_i1.p1 GENE.c19705_g2_i1~~c19705_g2_i1.p1  ORF type:complete len:451 (+),score=120.78 c19705_g2_i1:73-1425(+)